MGEREKDREGGHRQEATERGRERHIEKKERKLEIDG